MAIRVYNNVYALAAQRSLGTNQIQLEKSLEKLSSGLRINHASDDASGMAISEKLRGQITGMKRAAMNAQDGVSMLQTAEGGLEQVSSMLQRMRELAVQAANGVYTSNDRLEVQKEVDQLKDEIDRISRATEFNTKKLLNGDATALWSSDSPDLEARITKPVMEGNYAIDIQVQPGKNAVYKSDILSMSPDKIGAEIYLGPDYNAPANPNETNVHSVTDPNTIQATGTSYYTVTVHANSAANTELLGLGGTYAHSSSSWAVGSLTAAAALVNSDGGYIELEFVEALTSGSTLDALASNGVRARFIDAKTGQPTDWIYSTTAAGSVFTVSATGIDLTAAVFPGGATVTADIPIDISLPGGGVANTVNGGDKLLVSMSPGLAAANAGTALSSIGGGVISIGDGPNGLQGPNILYSTAESLTTLDNGDTYLDYQAVTVYVAELDSLTGNLNVGNITLNFRENGPAAAALTTGETMLGDFSLRVAGSGEHATSTTYLKDIDRFVNGDGINIFENKQELTIYGNGTSTTIYLEGFDTISTMEEKLTDAIIKLGMGSDDPMVNNNLVNYISVPTNYGSGTVPGTFVLQTAALGKLSDLAFIGDQALMDALSLNQIQEAEQNVMEVTVRDAHNGDLIGSARTGDDELAGIIEGVDILFDSRIAVTSSWDAATNSIVFAQDPALDDKKFHLHVVDNRTQLQIGANEGQFMDVSVPQLDVKGLGIDDVLLVSQSHAQRAITTIDRALTKVVSTRATIGAQVSRLEYTVTNLDIARTNMLQSESRIRDLDIAEETTAYTRYQMLQQSGIAMLSQANQLPAMAMQLLQF